MKIIKNKKGQGALEYLLLIGGAVLIAVIVIALLVGMGGQSRDTAADAANKAQEASDVPQPAQIVSVTATRANCDNTPGGDVNLSFSWRPLGQGGSYEAVLTNSANEVISIDTNNSAVEGLADDLNPNTLNVVLEVDSPENIICGDSHYLTIVTEKNQQKVESQAYRFTWN
jgi:hypothetical protein